MNTPENMPMSNMIELARNQIVEARRTLEDAVRQHGWKDRIEDVSGLLTCGLIALSYTQKDVIEVEISDIDKERGPHIPFGVRGIGLDYCPCCFVCGEKERKPGYDLLNNISGFVNSKSDGEKLVEWFDGKARLDFRESEPNWIQVKIGACDKHLDNLKSLSKECSRYRVIRQRDIQDAINL